MSDAPRKPGVLIVCDSYPPVLGGSEIEAQRVAAALIARGHKIRVLTSGGGLMPKTRHWTDPAGVPVSILTRYSRGRIKDFVFALQVGWSMFVRRRDFDIVYFLMQGLHVAVGLPMAHWLSKAVVMKISGDRIFTNMSRTAVGQFELGWLRDWQVPIMVLNQQMVREAEACAFPPEQLHWMPNPVEIDTFCPRTPEQSAAWRTSHKIPTNATVLIYTGRLSTEKGIRELMRGVAEAAQTEPRVMMVLIGDGPIRAELESLARELDPDPARFRFVGRIPLTEVPHWLGASDIFGLTSPNEGFSCSLVEAMSCGLPSVVSDIDANLQLVQHDTHGLTVPWNNPGRIAAAILRLSNDPALRQSLAAASRQRVVENYSIEKVLARYEALFDLALRHRA